MEGININYAFPFRCKDKYEVPTHLLQKRDDPKAYGQYLDNKGKRNKKN